MNGFFEDLEDGLEPIEADDEWWMDLDQAWEGAEALVGLALTRVKGEKPDTDTLVAWFIEDLGCEATDGCWVEFDGTCPHGSESWFLVLGLI